MKLNLLINKEMSSTKRNDEVGEGSKRDGERVRERE
jgi:hypothetical protein